MFEMNIEYNLELKMKIKIPFVEINTSEECPCNTEKEYQIKLKCVKTRLHSKYIASISIAICVWIFSGKTAWSEGFVAQMSFAGTITSIILSVLAIIMSISGENKTESIKDKLEDTVKELDVIIKKMENANDISIENTRELKENINELSQKMTHIPDEMMDKFERKFKAEKGYEKDSNNISIGWVSNNEK